MLSSSSSSSASSSLPVPSIVDVHLDAPAAGEEGPLVALDAAGPFYLVLN